MATYPAVEHRSSQTSRWLRERRLRVALLVGIVESLLVVFGGLPWFWVVAAALATGAFYVFVARRSRSAVVREFGWTAAASQLIALVVPVLWALVKVVAVVALVLMALVLLALLLRDR